ncbi:tetraacyldisaccharide 4'-kinase [Aestuariibacter halophilus]|uniref:Tetraacyldisaccharide 4'-kinase n=1 Tax=Fluctibacter halophilus TaxID=226011 RepID=A0ABS8G488_9ALTE|nr:tetraacyldisaccharide 4'-kinase [Aestuariibacter halophilus]MCC2615343.1 tetraacyldisaccharide 4'-kinase [Aestuariibacter halophilus]
MTPIEKLWYRRAPGWQWLVWFLAPLTALFWLVSALRRLGYRLGWLKASHPGVPVIVVGNISVGGNGKTPLVIRLAQWLRQHGYRPGVLSRGYGGKAADYPLDVTTDSSPQQVGDEPVLMRHHIGCPLVVDPKRARGANVLVTKHGCDVILCDDGLQHYGLKRDIEIVVVDGERRFGNGWLLPMGPLRESRQRLQTVDYIVANGGQSHSGEHLMLLEAGQLVNVKHPNQSQSLSGLKKSVIAAAAIGYPQRFFDMLKSRGVALKQTLPFPDHHRFTVDDLPKETLLMTEKDAVKCRDIAHHDWWYLPVTAKLSDTFKQQLLSRLETVRKNLRKSNGI